MERLGYTAHRVSISSRGDGGSCMHMHMHTASSRLALCIYEANIAPCASRRVESLGRSHHLTIFDFGTEAAETMLPV
jgi:hypothetical protein